MTFTIKRRIANSMFHFLMYYQRHKSFNITFHLARRPRVFEDYVLETRGPWWSYNAHLTKQICIFTVEVSAKFTALGFLYKLYSTNHPHPPSTTPPAMYFYKSWQLELNLKRGSPKEHFCQVILKLVQWFKKFYIAIKPYALTAMFFDKSWQLEQTW